MTAEEAAELNGQMAFRLGWKYHPVPGLWCLPGNDYQFTIPDFCRDNHALGYLLDWLKEKSYPIEITQNWCWWAVVNYDFVGKGETLGEALVRAILAAKEEGRK